MRRISASVLGTYIRPGQSVQTSHVSAVISIYVDSFSKAADVVDGDQDGQDDGTNGYENDEESSEVAQEKVGIKTTLFDNLSVLKTNHGSDHGEEVVGRRLSPLALGNKISFWFTRVCQYRNRIEKLPWEAYKMRASLLRRSAKRAI